MPRKIFVLLVAAFSLVACGVDPDDEARDDVEVETNTETGEEDTELADEDAETDDCAESSAAEGAPVGVTMMDNFYEPPCIAVSSTQEIALTNAGNIEHTFTVADGDIDVEVEPGEDATTDETGTDLAAGTYRFFCRYHEAAGMVGTLVVE
jgi:plastocyanin